jgi:hypothetical protein
VLFPGDLSCLAGVCGSRGKLKRRGRETSPRNAKRHRPFSLTSPGRTRTFLITAAGATPQQAGETERCLWSREQTGLRDRVQTAGNPERVEASADTFSGFFVVLSVSLYRPVFLVSARPPAKSRRPSRKLTTDFGSRTVVGRLPSSCHREIGGGGPERDRTARSNWKRDRWVGWNCGERGRWFHTNGCTGNDVSGWIGKLVHQPRTRWRLKPPLRWRRRRRSLRNGNEGTAFGSNRRSPSIGLTERNGASASPPAVKVRERKLPRRPGCGGSETDRRTEGPKSPERVEAQAKTPSGLLLCLKIVRGSSSPQHPLA